MTTSENSADNEMSEHELEMWIDAEMHWDTGPDFIFAAVGEYETV